MRFRILDILIEWFLEDFKEILCKFLDLFESIHKYFKLHSRRNKRDHKKFSNNTKLTYFYKISRKFSKSTSLKIFRR